SSVSREQSGGSDLFGALVLDLPLATVIERLPTGRFAIDLGLHVLLLGLTAEADDRRATFRILLRSVQQEVILRINFVLVRDQLHHQRCASFTVFRELAGSKEKPRSTVAQYVGIVDL